MYLNWNHLIVICHFSILDKLQICGPKFISRIQIIWAVSLMSWKELQWIEVSNEVITTANIESKLVIYNNRI